MFDCSENAAAAQKQSDRLKRHIADLSSEESIETNYFPNLGSVAVRARGDILKKLLKQPGLSIAALNRP